MSNLKVGLVMPAINTTLELELREWFPLPIDLSIARIKRATMLRPEDMPAERKRVIAAGKELFKNRPDVVIMGCTAAGFLAGYNGDREFCEDLQNETGAPTVSAAGSMLLALGESNAKTVTVLTPYGSVVNDALRKFIIQGGLQIAAFEGFEVSSAQELLAIDEAAVMRRAHFAAAQAMSDAIFVACSQLPTCNVLGPLARQTARPAWSSIKAAAWNACLTVGLSIRADA
ncbi:MAG: hypothetical protein WCJ99_00535 [Betaproteobacteria bacterium]|jgi:maleate cis-trans isomerase